MGNLINIDSYVGEEINIPNLSISSLEEDKIVCCPFMGFQWDGTSDKLIEIILNNVINHGIREFQISTGNTYVFRTFRSHPECNNPRHTYFIFDKNKKFINSCMKISEITPYLIN